MESQLSHVMEERKCADMESLGLRNQLDEAEDRVRVRIISMLDHT